MCDSSTARRGGSPIRRPSWSALYALTLVHAAALVAVELLRVPDGPRVTLRCALAVGVVLSLAIWIRRNASALDLVDWCACAGEHVTVRVVESARPAPPLSPDPGRAEPEPALADR
jgi:hypothetical protein